MKVGAGAIARTSDVRDGLAPVNDLPGSHGVGGKMPVKGGQAPSMVDDDHVSVAAHPTGIDDRAVVGRPDGGAVGRPDVDARMEHPRAEYGVDPVAEWRCYGS